MSNRIGRYTMKDKVEVKSDGVGLGGLFLVLFVGLKLGGVITWSWWWVLSPLWLPLVAALLILGFFLILTSLAALADFVGGKIGR